MSVISDEFRLILFKGIINYHYCTLSAKGADMTIESDSGYSPMALAVALGHKKSMYFPNFTLYLTWLYIQYVVFLKELTVNMFCKLNI